MNEQMKKLQEERSQLYNDFYNNIIPKRMFVNMSISNYIVAEYGGIDLFQFQYDYSKLALPAKKMCHTIYSDNPPVSPAAVIFSRNPSFYQLLGSQSFVMGTNGFVQHPEVNGMEYREYDELIKDPYAFILEKVIPRQYKEFDLSNPVHALNRLQMAKASAQRDLTSSMPWYNEIIEEFGYYPGAPVGSSGFTEAPYDFIADQLRGFTGMSVDIRRRKNLIIEACESVLPLMFNYGLPSKPHPEGCVVAPLHMPTFMREEDFAEAWLPSFKKLYEQYAALGIRGMAFCEDNWMRYLDYLMELPAGTILYFEYGDPQKIKDKLGKKFILQGMYPVELLKRGTKQQCIDKAKELMDIMLPGGGYIFNFDKSPLILDEVNMDNLIALTQFLREYCVYDNYGDTFGTPVNSEGFVFNEEILNIKSKYTFDWVEYKKKYPLASDFARTEFEKMDKEIFNTYISMLV